jgi:hypothetical protein
VPTELVEFRKRIGTEGAELILKESIRINGKDSEDDNLMHISHEAGILEDPMYTLHKSMLEKMVMPMDAPDKETRIVIHFKNGLPVKLINKEDGTIKEDSYDMYVYLNDLAGKNGIGLLRYLHCVHFQGRHQTNRNVNNSGSSPSGNDPNTKASGIPLTLTK